MADTTISFKFKKAVGFGLGKDDKSFGNFYPDMRMVHPSKSEDYQKRNIGGAIPQGDVPAVVGDYNWSKVFSITLLDETPPELPSYILENEDESIQHEFRLRNASTAAQNHEFNNHIRKQLNHQVKNGVIEIISDSFMRHPTKKKAPASKTK